MHSPGSGGGGGIGGVGVGTVRVHGGAHPRRTKENPPLALTTNPRRGFISLMAARAMSGSSILLAAAVAALLLVSAAGQSGCTVALIGLYPCMNYISGNETAPTKPCCSQLASVVKSQPQCLCSALGGDSVGGITINKTRALEMPKACNVQTPPASKCNNGTGGASAPGAAAAPTTPEVQTPAAAGSGSKATPSGYLQQNGVSSLHGPVGLVFVLAAAAVYTVSSV